jgi:RNA ligase
MDYKFPTIHTLNDVLPHIEGIEEFRVFEKEWYTVVNYMVALEDTFPSVKVAGGSAKMREQRALEHTIRRECRGLIFDKEGNLISRPYHKFFNIGEKQEVLTNKVNLNEPHVILEKLDGSMIRPIPHKDGFRLATKAGITDVAMNAEVFISDKPKYADFINPLIKGGFTPIFEWCSRKNRIVIDYPEDELILTAVRSNTDGLYVSYSVMKEIAETEGIPVVKAIAGDDTDIQKVVDHIRKWDDGEGVVLRFDSGHMVKIKADDYVLRHRSKDAINQEKNVIEVILNDSVDDVVPLLTEDDAHRLRSFQTAFWMAVEDVATDIHDAYCLIKNVEDQKKFATVAVPTVPKHYQPFMFKLRNGCKVKDLIVDRIGKSISSQTKVNENRWLWGDLKWA